MKSIILPVALALCAVMAAIASPEAVRTHDVEKRDVSSHPQLSPKAKFTFVVQCSPYKGKKGASRKGARETCNTMCFGTRCHFKKNTYNFDSVSDTIKNKRRTDAGCIPICKTDKRFSGMTGCDEFPLASTSEADRGDQIFRCVPKTDNESQGGQVSKAMKQHCKSFPCTFSFSFKDTKPYRYCNRPLDCQSDGNFFTKNNKPVKRDLGSEPEPETEQGGYYQLRSGATIYSPSDLEIGSIAVRNAYANQTIDEAEAARLEAQGLFVDDDDDEEEMIEDEVVKKL
ncbi:hypothetical protein F5Y11DRAFT_365843 [Daldinia sp. FL1419]|nr:hypothetical protein F5Y11DRAFT_365843 [Daldinia sp. FL1419]